MIPTRNEEGNVGVLLDRMGEAFASWSAEIIVVDDSDDDTPAALAAGARSCPVFVRLLHRLRGDRDGGLSGAVAAGARHARGHWVLVMDADLQHPPETAVALASTAMRHDCDLVVGTRYAGSGSPEQGLDGSQRQLVSSWATRLVKSAFPRRLAMVSDPLSGLFAFRRSAVDLDRLRPTGFKILLELLVRNPVARVAEVAYTFAPRNSGESKASAREGVTFLRHVARLRCARLASQLGEGPATRAERAKELTRLFAFGVIGASGLVVNTAALWFFVGLAGWNHLASAALATQMSTGWNFILVNALVYRRVAHGSLLGRATRFFVMNNLLLLGRLPVLELLVANGVGLLVANGVTLTLLFLVRFVVSDRAIFRSQAQSRDPVRILVDVTAPAALTRSAENGSPSRKRSRYLPYRYDIAGVVTIGSQIVLPEMEFFRAQRLAEDELDITVRVGEVGGRSPRRRAAMTEHAVAVRYEEHLGRLGANFSAQMGEGGIGLEVGPLLARSSHVVYTNIIEPLLRFFMVSRGYMLLHSACVELDGTGIMLSAFTDTGKTGTVLRLVREHGCLFLSDDMTIIDANGNAFCFPKPLTISAHTLRAVKADDLTKSEWRRLQIQSRLHSKSGRSIGMALSRSNLPIMGINALTQMLIPPPKYTVDRLVPCRMTASTKVSELFIIERGQPRLADLDHQAVLKQLIANTDDAYGFPPFRHLAPAITIGGRNYPQLREAERKILDGFLSHIRGRALASDTFSWADDIPGLLQEGSWPAGGVSGTGDLPGPRGVTLVADAAGSASPALNGHAVAGGPPGQGGQDGAPFAADGQGSDQTPTAPPIVAPPVLSEDARRRTQRGPRLLRSTWLYLTVVLAVATLFRFWQLATVGFNSDEAVYTGSAASLAGNSALAAMFPVFRAHPLLFQTLLSAVLHLDATDWGSRAFAATIGVFTVAMTFVLGRRLYGRKAGLIAALLLAVMPYHVVVSRQVLLDGLMTLTATAALYCVVRYQESGSLTWLLSAGAMTGLTILTKETSVVLVGGLYAFFVLTPAVRTRLHHIVLALLTMVSVAAVWPLVIRLSGHTHTGQSYLIWQLFRRSNHGLWFYFAVLPSWIGPAVLAATFIGLFWLRREATWRERLLLAWVVVPLAFFTIWPVKGFQYLLPIAPPLAVLAGRTLGHPVEFRWLRRRRLLSGNSFTGVLVLAGVMSLAVPTWKDIAPSTSPTFLAGTGGVSGGRQAGEWVLRNLPEGARLLAIGPSTANILEYYGKHSVSALSVSSNPHNHNPSYVPVPNPDLALRNGEFQYLVWDSYTASRSPFFSAELLRLASKFHGTDVFTANIMVRGHTGVNVPQPVVVIYEVYPR